jgi:hypothetical protein
MMESFKDRILTNPKNSAFEKFERNIGSLKHRIIDIRGFTTLESGIGLDYFFLLTNRVSYNTKQSLKEKLSLIL